MQWVKLLWDEHDQFANQYLFLLIQYEGNHLSIVLDDLLWLDLGSHNTSYSLGIVTTTKTIDNKKIEPSVSFFKTSFL